MLLKIILEIHIDPEYWTSITGLESNDVPQDVVDVIEDLVIDGFQRGSLTNIEWEVVSDE